MSTNNTLNNTLCYSEIQNDNVPCEDICYSNVSGEEIQCGGRLDLQQKAKQEQDRSCCWAKDTQLRDYLFNYKVNDKVTPKDDLLFFELDKDCHSCEKMKVPCNELIPTDLSTTEKENACNDIPNEYCLWDNKEDKCVFNSEKESPYITEKSCRAGTDYAERICSAEDSTDYVETVEQNNGSIEEEESEEEEENNGIKFSLPTVSLPSLNLNNDFLSSVLRFMFVCWLIYTGIRNLA